MLKSLTIKRAVIVLLFNFIGIMLASAIFSGIRVNGISWAILASVILSVLHMGLRPFLILVTLPFTILTFGIFLLIINGVIFWLAGNLFEGFQVQSFWSALGGAILVSILGVMANYIIPQRNQKQSQRMFFTTFTTTKQSTPNNDFIFRQAQRPPQESNIIDLQPDDKGEWKSKE